jgi:hypothetical protein
MSETEKLVGIVSELILCRRQSGNCTSGQADRASFRLTRHPITIRETNVCCRKPTAASVEGRAAGQIATWQVFNLTGLPLGCLGPEKTPVPAYGSGFEA